MRFDLPSAWRNPISLIGAAITTAMAVVFLALLALELGGQLRNPYVGLLLYVAVPAVFVFGLLLVAIGAWRHQRRVAAGATAAEWPVIDLRLPRTRTVVFAVALLTCVNILIVSLAGYGSVHHMETAEFCGTTCHTTMEPEWKAYQVSAHAEVACVSCHVGPGAGALVQSKINGTRQLWQVVTNNVPKPIPGPVHTMRPARETCQACHWAEKQHGEKLVSVREYADDEKSSETVTNLRLHVGGGRGDNRRRKGDGFEPPALLEVGELAGLRHFDVANRDRQRLTLIANAAAGGMLGLTASAGVGRDDYPDSPHGLQSYDSDQYSTGFTLTPDDRYAMTASYGWEKYRSLQRSRSATTAADQADPRRDWTTDYTGKVNFLEAGVDLDRVIERTLIRLSADWNRSNDTYLYGLVTGSPLAVPEQLPPVKNELLRSEVDVTYENSRNLRAGFAYWFDDYKVEDFALGATTLSGIALPPVQEGQPVTATNALLLGYLYRPYTAHAGFGRLTYLW